MYDQLDHSFLGTTRSAFVIGRKASRKAYRTEKTFVVGAYKIGDGRTFYTDPVFAGSRDQYPGIGSKKVGCGYRVIVQPKRHA